MITALICGLLTSSLSTSVPDALHDAVVSADTPERASKAYKALFTKHWPDKTAFLGKEPDTGIALQSAWEASHHPVKHFDKNTHWHWLYEPTKTKAFLEFFKKRTAIAIPDWWQKTVLNTEMAPGSGSACFGPHPQGRGEMWRKQADSFAVVSNGRTIGLLPLSTEMCASDAVEGKSQSYVVVIPFTGPGTLTCFGPDAKTVLWRASVWATGRMTLNGVVIENVTIVKSGDTITVFGEAGTAYAEAFDTNTGKSIFRFNTSYWQNWSESWKH